MSRPFRAGLVLLGVLSVLDLAGPLFTDGDNPPMFIALIGSALGLVSLMCVTAVWRCRRKLVLPLVVLRLISAVTASPAFFADGVPAGIAVVAAAIVLLTLVGIALVTGSREHEAVPA